MLTQERIIELSKRRGVKEIAVQNFLLSLDCSDALAAYANLQLDARLYRWNAATVKAIEQGLREAFTVGKKK